MAISAVEFLRRARNRALDRRPAASDFANIYFSGTTFALWRRAAKPTAEYSTGLVLDAGSGRGGWKSVIEGAGGRRESLDILQGPGERLDWVADLTDMPQVPSNRFDAAICHQVLEHVPRPHKAAGELARILKPGGILVLSAPHLSRLHELPHDYFRYTEAGLCALMSDAGLEILNLRSYGGVLSFIHHQLSTLLLGLASLTGPFYPAFVLLNAPFSILAASLDTIIDAKSMAPNGYICVARKPSSEGGGVG